MLPEGNPIGKSNNVNNVERPTAYETAWTAAAKEVAAKALPGLQVRCPRCHRAGTLLSKWVKGTPVKPLYIAHSNGNGHFKACALNKEEAQRARSKAGFTSKDVLKTLRMGRPYVLFSGGKDSLCLLAYLGKLAKQANLEITALHANTTAGFPEIEDYVKDVCAELGVLLVTVRPTHDYFDLAKRWGIPGVRSRWCCETLKVAPIRRFLAGVEGPKVVYDGIRAAESNIRATYTPVWYHPAFRCLSVSPLFRWSDNKVDSYINRNHLPKSPAADLGTSAECWCGAYKCTADFRNLLDLHPDIFDKLVQVEEAQGGKYTFLYENGNRVPLSSLREE